MLHDFHDGFQPASLRLGAILVGGQSSRFGSPKALALVGGVTLLERIADRVRKAGAHPLAITAPHLPDLSHLLPCRQDLQPGLGPLAGLHTALLWASELGCRGTLCIACDLPHLPAPMLRRLAEVGEQSPDTVIAPASPGPLGMEPLCAWYPTSAAPVVETMLEEGERALTALLRRTGAQLLPREEIAQFGDPASLFLNVNTLADAERAVTLTLDAGEANGRG